MLHAKIDTYLKPRQPYLFSEVVPGTLLAFKDCLPGPVRLLARLLAEEIGPVEATATFLTSGGRELGSQSFQWEATPVEGNTHEGVVRDAERLTPSRLGATLRLPDLTNTVLITVTGIESGAYLNYPSCRLQYHQDGRPLAQFCSELLVPGPREHRRFRFFIMKPAGKEKNGVLDLSFPDASGDTPAILRLVGCGVGGEAAQPLVDQAVGRDGMPLFCVPRARRIDNPGTQPRSLYFDETTRYFRGEISLIDPAGSAFFCMHTLRYEALGKRRYEGTRNHGVRSLARRIFVEKFDESLESLVKLHD